MAHLDLDCFYAQVESHRLNLPPTVPLVVQQWRNVIAVNYPARKFGIKRGMTASECKRLCPEVVCAQVELIEHEYDIAGTDTITNSSSSTTTGALSPGSPPAAKATVSASSASTGVVKKVSLERYRVASKQIMSIIYTMNPHCEQGGIDEIFLEIDNADVLGADGKQVATVEDFHREVLLLHETETGLGPVPEDAPELLGTWDGAALDPGDPFTRCLVAAALHIYRIRMAVLLQTGYVVSAGISGNKMLAKQASAARKPDKQTLVPPSSVDSLMRETRVKDLRGLGGKLGQQVVEATGAKCAFDLQSCTLPMLCTKFGDKSGRWIYSACRGIDDEPVLASGATADGSNLNDSMMKKSVAASKTFSPQSLADRSALMPWLTVLCTDIHARLVDMDERLRRRARSLSVHIHHRGASRDAVAGLSRTCKLPSLESRVPTLDVMVQCALRIVETRFPQPYPIGGISVSAGDFVTLQRGPMAALFGTSASSSSSSSSKEASLLGTDGSSNRTSTGFRSGTEFATASLWRPAPSIRSPVGILRYCNSGTSEEVKDHSNSSDIVVDGVVNNTTASTATDVLAAVAAFSRTSNGTNGSNVIHLKDSGSDNDSLLPSAAEPQSPCQPTVQTGIAAEVSSVLVSPVPVAAHGTGVLGTEISDLECARRLQRSYDREDEAISSFPVGLGHRSKKRKTAASSGSATISQFFTAR